MQVSVTFRQMEATPALKDHATDRVQKIAKYISKPTDAHVVLSLEKYMHKADITLNTNGLLIRGAEKSEDMYSSIDRAIEKIERQLKRYREKLKRHQPRQSSNPYRVRLNVLDNQADENQTDEMAATLPARVVETEEFDATPMTVDEAIMQMDLLDNKFLVFQNAGTAQLNVIYRRKDGFFGLIEVATGGDKKVASA